MGISWSLTQRIPGSNNLFYKNVVTEFNESIQETSDDAHNIIWKPTLLSPD